MRPIDRRVVAAIALIVVASATIGWMERFEYNSVSGGGYRFPVRVNRFTGTTEQFSFGRWRDVSDKASAQPGPLPAEELAKVHSTGAFRDGHEYAAEVYNGSTWKIEALEYAISANVPSSRVNGPDDPLDLLKCATGTTIWTRRLRHGVAIAPLSVATLEFTVGNVRGACATDSLVGALGRP